MPARASVSDPEPEGLTPGPLVKPSGHASPLNDTPFSRSPGHPQPAA